MLFNRNSFNRDTFNRSSGAAAGLLAGAARVVFDANGQIHSMAPLQGVTGIAFDANGNLVSTRPYGDTVAGIDFDGVANLAADAYCSGSAGIVFDAIASAIRVNNDTELALEGLTFAPGDTIIIDTETLDIFINGEPDVASWVVGSNFFQFEKGTNALTFYDNATSRELTVTVLWADRWL